MDSSLEPSKVVYYLVCPKCKRVMAEWFLYCGGLFGQCQVRKEQGVWVRSERTIQIPKGGGSDNRIAITLEGALPHDAL